jgi:hypothetical protein
MPLPSESVHRIDLLTDADANRNFEELHLKLRFNPVHKKKHQLLLDGLLAFFKTHHINIYANNLSDNETSNLQKIIDAALLTNLNETPAKERLRSELAEWKKTLARAIDGSDKDIYAAQKIITSDLIKHKKVNLTDLGTDLDIINCLGKDKFTNVASVTTAGTYVVEPCALTTANMKEIIEAGLNVNASPLELLVPVNIGNRHWRLAKIKIQNHRLVDAELWDSLGNKNITNTIYFQNFQIAVESAESKSIPADAMVEVIQVNVNATGIQTNAHSCMDYVIQEIFKSEGLSLDNAAITDAQDANALRLAVVKQIATNVPELGETFADTLKIEGDFIAGKVELTDEHEKIELTDEHEKFLQAISMGGKVQVDFDDEFAKQIQRFQTSIRNESKLQKVAFLRAYSLFKQKNPNGALAATIQHVNTASYSTHMNLNHEELQHNYINSLNSSSSSMLPTASIFDRSSAISSHILSNGINSEKREIKEDKPLLLKP